MYNNPKKIRSLHFNFIDQTKKVSSIHHFEKISFIKKFISNIIFKKIATLFVGEGVMSHGAELFVKPKNKDIVVPPHQDNYYWNVNNSFGVTIWVSLNDSNKKKAVCIFINLAI